MDSSNDIYEVPIISEKVADDEEKLESAAIIIDEDSEKDNDCTIIDVDNVDSSKNEPNITANVLCFDELCIENKLFTELIEKYLDMEDSQVMLQIINRKLIPLYKNACRTYKNSPAFEKLLTSKLIQIDTLPDRKFTQIKGLCVALEANAKKRASFVTLNSNLNDKFTKKSKVSVVEPMKKNIPVIDLDDDDDDVQISCDNDTTNQCSIKIKNIRGHAVYDEAASTQVNSSTDVELIDTESDSDIQIHEQNVQTTEDNEDDDLILVDDENSKYNKENRTITENNKIKRCERVVNSSHTKKIKIRHSLNNNIVTSIDLSHEGDDTGVINKELNTGERVFQQLPQIENIIRIKEKEIESCNKLIKLLEESDVTDDTNNSPYVQSECLKAKVVDLYKQICKLKGTSSFKRHKVRLKVAAERSKGPARCLEQFINDNIDENGNPLFPDMVDVLNCVRKANFKYSMGLYEREIQAEARALFIQYGRIVQKKRQKREWRHLLTYVKKEVLDPADEDLMLAARLEENAKVAKKNENELFDRFAKMENAQILPNPELNMESSCDSEQDRDTDSAFPIPSASCRDSATRDSINCNVNGISSSKSCGCCNGNNITDNVVIYNPTPVQEVSTPNSALGTVGNAVNEDKESSSMIENLGFNFEIPPSNIQFFNVILNTQNLVVLSSNQELSSSETSRIIDNQRSLETKSTESPLTNVTVLLGPDVVRNLDATSDRHNSELRTRLEQCTTKKSNHNEDKCDAGSSQADSKPDIVKREPLDIPRMLEELGDNFTTTVIEIDDPGLVVEISDSESDDDEVEPSTNSWIDRLERS